MRSRRLARFALFIVPIAGAASGAALPQLAHAAGITIAVTTTADNPAADCTGSNECSLRQAVLKANNDSGDVIQLGAHTYDLTIAADIEGSDDGTTGDLEIRSNMTIQGAGANQTVIRGVGASGPWTDRIIEADNNSAAPTVTIQDLKVTGGNDTGQYSETDGGAILADDATLTVHNVIVDSNHSDSDGGGVASNTSSAETFTISNSTLSNNTAGNDGGGLFVGGSTSGTDSGSSLFLTGNTANGGQQLDSGGGAIYNDLSGTGSITFSDVMAVSNHAPGMGGGGVYDNGNLTSQNGSVIVRRPTVWQRITLSNNDARIIGGGFYTANSLSTLINATITKNAVVNNIVIAVVGNGGGIAAGRAPAQITVNNATINGNSSPGPGGGAASVASGDQIHLHNTILVKNTSGTGSSDCFKGGVAPGVIDSTGYNIVDDTTCALVPASDRQGSTFNPNLGALQDNGGPADGAPTATSPTLTEALPTGSIAIDTADPAGANNPATDERGITRPQAAQSDVGAFEAVPAAVAFVAPVLPKAGHLPPGSGFPTLWVLLALIVTATLGAVGLRVRVKS
jgi:CSLREA domain-containing protein